MGKVISIISEKFFNQFSNGEDFSANTSDFAVNLVGNVGEKVKAVYRIGIEWFSNADDFDVWNIDGTALKITRTTGNFREDGFQVGHVFDFISNWTADNTSPIEFNGTVTAISTDGRTLYWSYNSGITPTGSQSNVGIRALNSESANYLTALFWRFGIVANDADYTNISNATGNQQTFFGEGIGLGSPRSTTPVALSAQGTYKDWLSGTASCKFDSNEGAYVQVFEIAHTFVVTPFYLDGQLSDIQSNVLPDYLEGENSLKYAFQSEFRQVVSNPNTAITVTYDDNLGSVGWFNERFNGLSTDYSVVSISYTDTATATPIDAIQAKRKTSVSIEIDKLSGAFVVAQKARVFIIYLANQSQYQDTTTDLLDNFLYESLATAEGVAPVNGSIITALELTLSAGNLVASFDIEYTPAQQSYISGGAYIVAIQVANSALSAQESDRILLLADAKNYISSNDVADLHEFTKMRLHFAQSEIGVDDGNTDFRGYNEDSLAIEFEFWLDLDSSKQAFLNSLQFALIAYNTTTGAYFDFDRFDLPLQPNTTIVAGAQRIEIDGQRTYLFEDGNQYRRISLTTGALVGTKQYYSGVFSQKIRWEDWIANADADTDFYDNTKPNNNLNFKSSNYSQLLDYEIRVQALADVAGIDSSGESVNTLYSTLSNTIQVGDYGNNADFIATVQTFDESGTNSTGGVLIQGANTLVRATFTALLGAISDLTGYDAIIRLQAFNSQGQQIYELATFYGGFGGILIPKSGFSFVDLYIDGGNAVAECLIDGNAIDGSDFVISARIIAPDPPIQFIQFMNGDNALFMNDDIAKFLNQ